MVCDETVGFNCNVKLQCSRMRKMAQWFRVFSEIQGMYLSIHTRQPTDAKGYDP